jgi:hypothetical protein
MAPYTPGPVAQAAAVSAHASQASAAASLAASQAAASAAAAASPSVDGTTRDDRFLTLLRMAGITPSSDGGSTTISDAMGMCVLLQQGKAPEPLGAALTNYGMTPSQAREFLGAAVAAYCPGETDVVRSYVDVG